MKQVVQNYKTGELAVVDVPVPDVQARRRPGAHAFSLISTGTEMMKVTEAEPVAGGARRRPAPTRSPR